jgi:hypothetical protein
VAAAYVRWSDEGAARPVTDQPAAARAISVVIAEISACCAPASA